MLIGPKVLRDTIRGRESPSFLPVGVFTLLSCAVFVTLNLAIKTSNTFENSSARIFMLAAYAVTLLGISFCILLIFRTVRSHRRWHESSSTTYEIDREIQTINRDLDQVRSLLLSQSKEFLIDAAVVEKATQKYDKSSSSELRSSKDETF